MDTTRTPGMGDGCECAMPRPLPWLEGVRGLISYAACGRWPGGNAPALAGGGASSSWGDPERAPQLRLSSSRREFPAERIASCQFAGVNMPEECSAA